MVPRPRPKALDLFCGAGGASKGIRAGYARPVGVDINPQPRYPYEFIRMDAIEYLDQLIAGPPSKVPRFIWASPPCQGYTRMVAPGQTGAPRMISEVRERLQRLPCRWAIENVEGARSEMRTPITLCGSMFGLGCYGYRLQRHRLIETNFPIVQPTCVHPGDVPVVGVYGGHARVRSARHGGRKTRDKWPKGHRDAMRKAMDIDWMYVDELSEAVPPAYGEYVAGFAAIWIREHPSIIREE